MKQPNLLLKVAAVVSSVLLTGGFVAYRAGTFDGLIRTSPEAVDSESNLPDTEPKPSDEEKTTGFIQWKYTWTPSTLKVTSDQTPQTYISGPKSAIIATPEAVDNVLQGKPKPPVTTKPARPIMSGTKSFSPAKFIEGLTPAGTFQQDTRPK